MSAPRAPACRGLLASALASATDWLIAPPENDDPSPGTAPARNAVVAVAGVAPRCGVTTVARALGAELAARHASGACAVACGGQAIAVSPAAPAAVRLARALPPHVRAPVRPCGRLCLIDTPDRLTLADAVRPLAPLLIDVEDPAEAWSAAALADATVLVATSAAEPALAAVLAHSLERVGPRPLTVLNRARRDDERWAARTAAELPDSRIGARLALAGRDPRGDLGHAIAVLADRCAV